MASVVDGVIVTVLALELYETVAATLALPFKSRTVLVVTLLALSASLNATVIEADVATFVVPPAGLTPLTVGGVVSAGGAAIVVKVDVKV